jgi:LPXTG-motif cell wall-anchored protein
MNKSVLYIVGAVALLGGGAFLFLRNKNKKDKEKLALAELQKLGGASKTDSVINTPLKEPVVKTITDKELKEIQILRDVILSDMQRKGTYRTSGSRDAVQSDINQNLEKLKVLGYTLDLNNNLVKV